MVLKDLPTQSRPRERLLKLGAGVLTDAELIALLLRTGLRGVSVLQLAQNLLDQLGGLQGLLRAAPPDFKRIKGLGPAKQAEMMAVLELARRATAQELSTRPVFESPQKIKDYVSMQLGGLGHEVFALMWLDAKQQLLSWEELFRGTLTHTAVYPREVVKRALQVHAQSVILVHNHPSGVAEPSSADAHLTQQLRQALALVDVRVLDHLVVGEGQVISMADRGLL
ncbi:MAG: DNA repair protein RadC [Burkholderiales bacterium]